MVLAVAETSAQQYRASVGCPPEKIDSLPPNSTLEDLQRACFGQVTPPKPPPEPKGKDPPPPPPPPRYFNFHEGRDIDGMDFRRLTKVIFETCVQECQSDRQCHAFSFDKWNRYCFLKHVTPTTLRIEPNSIVAVISTASPATSFAPTEMQRYRGRVFPESGFQQTKVSSFEDCETACESNGRCEVFSFLKGSRACRLIARPGEYFRDANVDSGVKRQKP
ncbi:MAG: PAN domain-containing protein [Hyphomicrobiaceae bacterium]